MLDTIFCPDEISVARGRLNAYRLGNAYALPATVQDAEAVPISRDVLARWCVYRENNYPSFSLHAFAWDLRRLVGGDPDFLNEWVVPLLQAWSGEDEDYERLWADADRPPRDDDVLVLQDLASIHHNSANNGLWELVDYDEADEVERADIIRLHILFNDLIRTEFDRLDVVVGNTDPVAVSRLLLSKSVISITDDDLKDLPIRDRLRIENKIIEAHHEAAKQGAYNMGQVIPLPPAAPKPSPLPLTYFDECRTENPARYVIKDLLAEGATSTLYGPPKSLKSTLAVDIGVHLAAGREWRGRKIPDARGVVYFALERGNQVRKALKAYAIRDGFERLPIAVVSRIINMLDPSCVEVINETISHAEKRFETPVGLIILDVWNKAIAAGGGSEDKAEYQNMAAANLRRLIDLRPALHCLTVGHTGKDTAKGERGSNATMGDRDVGILLEGTSRVRKASIAYANDLADGEVTTFEGEQIVVGDDAGEPRTAFIVSRAAPLFTPSKAATTRQTLALKGLRSAIESHGQEPPEGSGIPSYLRVVALDRWRDELFRVGVLNKDAKNPREPFRRLKTEMLGADQIVEQDGFVWPMQPGGIILPPFPR